jgi:hypothetical protein
MIEKNRITLPITRKSLKKLCEKMDFRISERQIIEALIFCRGPKMEQSENFSLEKLVQYLDRVPVQKEDHDYGATISTFGNGRRGSLNPIQFA